MKIYFFYCRKLWKYKILLLLDTEITICCLVFFLEADTAMKYWRSIYYSRCPSMTSHEQLDKDDKVGVIEKNHHQR